MATKRGGGAVKAGPLRKKTFFDTYYLKNPMATKVERGGGGPLMAWPRAEELFCCGFPPSREMLHQPRPRQSTQRGILTISALVAVQRKEKRV